MLKWCSTVVAPDEFYREARLEATYHLQLTIEDTSGGEPGVCYMTVSGPVVRVFRGPAALMGSYVNIKVPTYRKGDPFPPGGERRFAAEDVQVGKVLEAYVDETPKGLEASMGGKALLDHPTDTSKLDELHGPVTSKIETATFITPSRAVAVALLLALAALIAFVARQ